MPYAKGPVQIELVYVPPEDAKLEILLEATEMTGRSLDELLSEVVAEFLRSEKRSE